MEVINAVEDLRVTDGGGEVDAVTGIGRFLRELVLYNTPIISVQYTDTRCRCHRSLHRRIK